MIKSRFLSIERVEPRHCLASIVFSAHEVADVDLGDPSDAWAVPGDMDGDGDEDIVTPSLRENGIVWIENVNGTFSTNHEVGKSGPEGVGYGSIVIADIDGDGDADIVSATARSIVGSEEQFLQADVMWFENTNGKGQFSGPSVISSVKNSGPFVSLDAADLDSDNDVDLLVWFNDCTFLCGVGRLASYENKGDGEFSDEILIADQIAPQSVIANDINGDGDLDVVVVAQEIGRLTENPNDDQPSTVLWHENVGGENGFTGAKVIDIVGDDIPQSVNAIDVDRDGDLDIVSSFFSRGMSWHENLMTETPTFAVAKRLTKSRVPDSLRLADLDNDGDQDLVAREATGDSNELVWFENTTDFSFDEHNLISKVGRTRDIRMADFDGDGDPDLLVRAVDRISWYENRLIGDADDNGKVDFADFLAVSASFGKQVDAVWNEGDFDGSGSVDFSDFLALSANFGANRLFPWESASTSTLKTQP